MEESLLNTRESVQDALDTIASTRSSSGARTAALQTLERHLVLACLEKSNDTGTDSDCGSLFPLQYTFECNIPSRLVAWIGASTAHLEALTNKSLTEGEKESEAFTLSSQISTALCLIQGVALSHEASKYYLGRKYALEIFLDLLLASRHLSPDNTTPTTMPTARSTSTQTKSLHPSPLTSVVLDTLLCILVDSPSSMRAFEEVKGVQNVVKILKRAGTPREVRMKCLEFLYFYLLDETTTPPASTSLSPTSSFSKIPEQPTVPSTPVRSPNPSGKPKPKPYMNGMGTPLRPSSHLPSSNSLSFQASSSRSTSGSSAHSFSSTSSNVSSSSYSTSPSSLASSPEKVSHMLAPLQKQNTTANLSQKEISEETSPQVAHRFPNPQPLQLHTKPMMMFRKEVDYEPLSPTKPSAQTSTPQHGKKPSISRSHSRSESRVLSRLGSCESQSFSGLHLTSDRSDLHVRCIERKATSDAKLRGGNGARRTTEEKKELLGTMLGNVDALVEGVRKAGIWGLG